MAEQSPLKPLHEMNNRRGLMFMTAGFFCFSCADLLSKVLTETYHPFQITWMRQLGLLVGVIVLLGLRGPGILRTKAPLLQFFRGLIAIVSALSFVFALRYVPLAEGVAVSFVAPFIVTIMGALLLGEKVGIRRWAAISVGFIGIIVIIRPGSDVFQPAILLVLLAALCFAARQVLSRYLGSSEATSTTVAYSAIISSSLLFVPMVLVWITPATWGDVMLFAALAAVAGLGELLIIRALEIANAVVVAPMHYSLIIFSSIWGFMVFGVFPDGWTWVGAGIVVASGLYTLHRESKVGKPTVPGPL